MSDNISSILIIMANSLVTHQLKFYMGFLFMPSMHEDRLIPILSEGNEDEKRDWELLPTSNSGRDVR